MHVCVCLFVYYKKESVSFDSNNGKFTQKNDDCMGRVITLFDRKQCRIGSKILENVLGRYEKLHFVYRLV